MFEKEAIRHAFEVTIGLDCLIKPAEEFTYEELNDHLQEKADDFQDGAEFGYNKANEEMQEQGLALQSDMDKTIEQNIQLKKQNNWLEGCKLELAEHLGKTNDRVSELEQQIEKMKVCQNCKFEDKDCIEEPCSACTRCLGDIKRKGNSDKWEIKENDRRTK